MPVAQITVDAALFDLDGTLVLSTDCVALAWTAFHKKHNVPIDPDFFHQTHGMRTIETFRKYFPQLEDEGGKASAAFDLSIAEDYHELAKPVAGGAQLVSSIPQDRWCVVTSGSHGIAHGWFDKVLIDSGLPKPKVFLTSDDVENGKPDPEPYAKGALALQQADNLTTPFQHTVVFEDAPNGIKSGVASGAVVIGIMSTFDADTLYKYGASYAVKDLTHVKVVDVRQDKTFVLEIDYIEKNQ